MNDSKDDLKLIFDQLEKYSSDLLSNWKGCTAQLDKNGVVHLINQNGYSVAMMTQTDYEAILKYSYDSPDSSASKK